MSAPSEAARFDAVPRGVPNTFEFVEGWGMTSGAPSRVLRPRTLGELRSVFAGARRDGTKLVLRGSGCSYGDASVNARGDVVELGALSAGELGEITRWDPASGVAECGPGVTIAKLWRHVLADGYWPRVVSGTMFPALGGAAAMNIHGKNNFAVGTIGDAIREFDLLTPAGELLTCDRTRRPDVFHAAIGGLGLLGAFTRIVIETKRVYSGDLEVRGIRVPGLAEAMDYFEEHKAHADYLVAWLDCFARHEALGRGLIHEARYLPEGADPDPRATLTLAHQELPPNILGVPKSEVWRALRLLNHDGGMRALNTLKHHLGVLEERRGWQRQSHAAFAFLLDYVPNWKWAYGRSGGRGLIQYQAFVPKETAYDVYKTILVRSQRAGHVPYLGVLKRHRPDPFLLTHACDGWSLALDFKVTPENRASLWQHARELTRVVLDGGGKFYFAKDLVIGPEDTRRMFGAEKLAEFARLKRELDPESVLEGDLARRVFAGAA